MRSDIARYLNENNMKICIIDDDPICHFIAEKMIEKVDSKSELSHFQNGREALDFFTEQQDNPERLPDLIFVDINMPVLNGWNFLSMLEELKIKRYDPNIFICSSSNNSQDLARAHIMAGVNGYLNKPLNPRMLQNVFQNIADPIHC